MADSEGLFAILYSLFGGNWILCFFWVYSKNEQFLRQHHDISATKASLVADIVLLDMQAPYISSSLKIIGQVPARRHHAQPLHGLK